MPNQVCAEDQYDKALNKFNIIANNCFPDYL